MAAWKFTMLLQMNTDPVGGLASVRVGGWSESLYQNNAGPTNRANFLRLCQARAALLPTTASVIGQRYQQVDPVGASSTGAMRYPGDVTTLATDVPQVTLLCRAPSTETTNIRPLMLRCIPDGIVIGGEYSPNAQFRSALANYFQELGFWKFRARDLQAQSVPIIDIDALGNVNTDQPITLTVNETVQILRTTGGTVSGGRFSIKAVTDTFNFQLRNWKGGATEGGRLRLISIIYPRIDSNNVAVSRIIVRKVGRGFFQYRGRASKRK
jgi:hypothetical protein